MTESVPNTLINTQAGGTACNNFNSYLMADPNWQGIQTFQPNVACANYLPPEEGCCWQLQLVKKLDPIVCGDSCQCDCEDHVHFEVDGAPGNAKYCDFDAPPLAGWCGSTTGPHNVLATLPFHAGENSSRFSDHLHTSNDHAHMLWSTLKLNKGSVLNILNRATN